MGSAFLRSIMETYLSVRGAEVVGNRPLATLEPEV